MAYPNFINSEMGVDNTNKTYSYVHHGSTWGSPFTSNKWTYNDTEKAIEILTGDNVHICQILYPLDLYVYDTFKNLKLTLVAKSTPTSSSRMQFFNLRTNKTDCSPNTMFLRMRKGNLTYIDRSKRYNSDQTVVSEDDNDYEIRYDYMNSSGISMSDQYFKDAYHTHEVTISNGKVTYKIDDNICVNNQELPSDVRKFSYSRWDNNNTQQRVDVLLLYTNTDQIYLKSLTVTSEVYMLDSITGSYTKNGITTYYRTSFTQQTYGSNVVNYVADIVKI